MSKKISKKYRGKIQHLGIYHPYHGGHNQNFDAFSGKILDLKQNKQSGLTYFFNMLKRINFDKTEAIVIVPPHNPTHSSSLIPLANFLADKHGWTKATSCVKRTKRITKLTAGGSRSKAVHLSSIKIKNKKIIKGKNVLVLDDVTTSGNSLKAVMKLLRKAGARSVWAYALAKTS